MSKQRLDKALCHMGVGSRREVKAYIHGGRVKVDGAVVDDPGLQVDPDMQSIVYDGESLTYQQHFHVMLHKPGGVITATEDPRKKTVMDVLPPELVKRNLGPVGRLDKDTEGLLLLTTDGELAHRLLSPKYHVPKRYLARLDLPLVPSDPPAFEAGIVLEDGYECLPAQLEIVSSHEGIATLHEGKYHQVKRMFKAVGKEVVYLKRLSMGPLELGDLPLGEARTLTEGEVAALYAACGVTSWE
ncbi:MAG: pseudouridine synthase [Mycobacterium leprae]